MDGKGKGSKRTVLWLTVALGVYLCFSPLPAADGFMAFDHRLKPHLKRKMNNLIRRVHKEQWVIGYVYMDNCPPAARNNGKAIEEAITISLNAWLQPVRELNTGQPVVDDFRYEHKLEIAVADFKLYDLRIYFYCDIDKSHAVVLADEARPPALLMHRGTFVNDQFAGVLLHEIGHAFGLLDTYTNPERIANEELRVSRGGLARTIGHQPASVMSVTNFPRPLGTHISQDDANGIVWLYRFYHENLPLEDCIFADYELEKGPEGCRPKSPLIFEIKYGYHHIHGYEHLALRVLDEDENTDINAKDGEGMTALHHAIIKGYPQLVDKLLEHKGLDVNSADGSGMTALHYAVREKFTHAVEALLAHDGIDVNVQDGKGMTALHYAVKGRFPAAVEWLLGRADLDTEVKDKDGLTALALANQLGYTELADLISPPVEEEKLSVRLGNSLATLWGAVKVR